MSIRLVLRAKNPRSVDDVVFFALVLVVCVAVQSLAWKSTTTVVKAQLKPNKAQPKPITPTHKITVALGHELYQWKSLFDAAEPDSKVQAAIIDAVLSRTDKLDIASPDVPSDLRDFIGILRAKKNAWIRKGVLKPEVERHLGSYKYVGDDVRWNPNLRG